MRSDTLRFMSERLTRSGRVVTIACCIAVHILAYIDVGSSDSLSYWRSSSLAVITASKEDLMALGTGLPAVSNFCSYRLSKSFAGFGLMDLMRHFH